jgi:hypothetical protein
MAKGLDQEKRQAWVARLKRFRASGLTIAKFCEDEKVSVQTYYYWLRRIGRRSTAERPTPRGALAHTGQSLAPDSRIHFQLGGGVEVSIPADCLAAIRCLVQCLQQPSAGPASSFHQVLLRDATVEAS